MTVELFVPEAFMGDVIGDLNARGGKIESIASKTGLQVIRAIVPLGPDVRLFNIIKIGHPGQRNIFHAVFPL